MEGYEGALKFFSKPDDPWMVDLNRLLQMSREAMVSGQLFFWLGGSQDKVKVRRKVQSAVKQAKEQGLSLLPQLLERAMAAITMTL